MCDFKLDYESFGKKWNIDFLNYFSRELKSIPVFVEEGILSPEDYGFSVTFAGRHFLRNVAMVFDTYLAKMTGQKKPVFSNSI